MVETIIMSTWIAVILHISIRHGRKVPALWREATWFEKLALCLLFVPIPGPIDEIVAAIAISRILARRSQTRTSSIC